MSGFEQDIQQRFEELVKNEDFAQAFELFHYHKSIKLPDGHPLHDEFRRYVLERERDNLFESERLNGVMIRLLGGE